MGVGNCDWVVMMTGVMRDKYETKGAVDGYKTECGRC
jgi:hypothetical protein